MGIQNKSEYNAMRETPRNSVYNAPIPEMVLSSRWSHICLLLLAVLTALPGTASPWQASSSQLAQKIVAATGPGAVHLTLTNRSSLSSSSVEAIRRALFSELSDLGLRSADADQAAATVDVTLSENLQHYVWTAEIHQGTNEPSVVMVTATKTQADMSDHQSAALVIRKTLLWSDENRILDLAFLAGTPQRMVVLEPENVLFLALQNGHWQQEQSLTIVHAHPWPRDLRGRLILRRDHLFDAYLPGTFCRCAKPGVIDCRPSDDPWPLSTDQVAMNAFFAPTRNFFTGVLSPGIQKQTAPAPFYSAAALPRDRYSLWLFAGVDGQVRLLDGVTDQTAGKIRWGSEIAGVHSGCGTGWQVLATGAADGPSDSVTAYEVPDHEITTASQPLDFKSSITAMWTDADESGAIAVSQDADSRMYEAYRLTIVCGQ